MVEMALGQGLAVLAGKPTQWRVMVGILKKQVRAVEKSQQGLWKLKA